MMCILRLNTLILVAPLLFSLSAPAPAEPLIFGLGQEFSGATAPWGQAPWLTAVFDDDDSPGTVTLLLEATHLYGTEFVSKWDFNLDPTLDPELLVFGTPIKTGSFTAPDIGLGVDDFKAGGDGKYDIQFSFSTDNVSGSRFGVGESMTIEISGIPTLMASSFDFESAPAGGQGPYYSAAHVQGIGTTGSDSGWIAADTFGPIPEPSSGLLLVLAVAGMVVLGRRMR